MKNCKNVQYYYFGKNSLDKLKELLEYKRADRKSKVFFLIDEFFKTQDLEQSLPINLTNDTVIYCSSKEEPHAEYINELTDRLKEISSEKLPVAVVGIGGGTVMDISKCISILLTNPGKVENYQGWDLVLNPAVYKIGIPTISGTGAEVTRTAVLTSKVKKLGINSNYSVFDQIICDPKFLSSVPNDKFMYTAMDCYVHCVESLRGNTNDAMTIALAQKSLSLLDEIFTGEMEFDKLMTASIFGGSAVANSNVGICHPLSYGLSLVLGLHHGYSICIAFNQLEEYYPEVLKFRTYLKKNEVELPQNITKDVSQGQMQRMVEATLKNEIPLANAFGENWREVFSPSKVEELFLKM